ncbi:putative glyoxalase superfamily protein PhnB [Nocardioides cavernae]|uniref:Putative glyoxalase superfamily protein PhnB n=1 Tax=Nocardioides cavernae TaxID=1921566 RepID=A0A7Y9H589_9ACTN|nr:VOC family protein [Nocardioides cavernae]NYE38167.1 putative glyoxalase superfamily protein PhnB [Nocardioides cavernae]
MSKTPDVSRTTLWHTFVVRDAEVMTAWLAAVGFTEHATHRDEQDDSVVVHAEWAWPGGGGIMFGTARDDSPLSGTAPAAAYLVTPDPDAAFDAAVAAGATVVRPMEDHDYGGRGGSVNDPEGNHWSFGSYQPA